MAGLTSEQDRVLPRGSIRLVRILQRVGLKQDKALPKPEAIGIIRMHTHAQASRTRQRTAAWFVRRVFLTESEVRRGVIRHWLWVMIVVWCGAQPASAQTAVLDSLTLALEQASDSARVTIYRELTQYHWQNGTLRDLTYIDRAEALAEARRDTNQLLDVLRQRAAVISFRGDYAGGLAVLNEAIQLNAQRTGAEAWLRQGNLHIAKAVLYRDWGDLGHAIEALGVARRAMEAAGHRHRLSYVYGNLAQLYNSDGQRAEALENYTTALRLRDPTVNPSSMGYLHANIASLYVQMGVPDSAWVHLEHGQAHVENKAQRYVGARAALARVRTHYYLQAEAYPEALAEVERALAYAEARGDKRLIARLTILKGDIDVEIGDLDEAARLYHQALSEAQALGTLRIIRLVSQKLASLYQGTGNFAAAFQHQTRALAYRDSLYQQETTLMLARFEAEKEAEQREEARRVAERLEQLQEFRRLFLLFSILGLSLAIGLLGWWRFRIARKKQAVLREEAASLARLDALKTHFFANISHELRTPLTLTFGPIHDVLEQHASEIPASVHQKLGRAQVNGQRLLRLINQIMDLTKMEGQALELRPEPLDVARFVRQLVAQFDSLAASAHLTLQCYVPVAPIYGAFDRDKLEKIVSNLLSNALKFTLDGGTVSVRLEAEADAVTLTVSDTGIGIAPEHLSRLFERFYQADSTRAFLGTGLGLALVKELVDLHGGTIHVESVPDRGTTFVVRLPYTPLIPRDTQASDASVSLDPFPVLGGADPSVRSLPASAPSKVTADIDVETDATVVLVVDDHPEIRGLLYDQLAPYYTVRTAENGQLGYHQAQTLVPDVIISDVMMPEMDGLDLCHALKTDERTSHIPVILLTARADIESRLAGRQRGADAYLAKPFHSQELRAIIDNVMATQAALRTHLRLRMPIGGDGDSTEVDTHVLEAEDQQFLETLRLVVISNMADPAFGVDALAEALHMSQRQGNRKVKALTGDSLSVVIRSLRLERAAELLATGLSVKQVANDVGYKSTSHFSRAFSGQFGVSPSQYVKTIA